jgi:trans-2,3-dihydro-3-hydroxyanthranilate isomerase
VSTSAQLDYFIVDVFTETPLAGNPLAVVMNTCGLSTEHMQAVAREFNLSETTFVERRPMAIEREEGVRVRIFTTQEELNFAGHPTLGTAAVLKTHAPETIHSVAGLDTVTLALNVGAVPVHYAAEGLNGTMMQRDPEFGVELDPACVSGFAGLEPDDFDPALPPQIVSTGNPFAIVVLRSAHSLARLRVDQQAATPWLRERGARWFYVLAPEPNQGQGPTQWRWRARMQFYGSEDPATGSAAGCAIGYLVGRGAVPSEQQIHLRQGVEIGRPSDLYLSARLVDGGVTDVRVGGSTVLVAKGRLFLP